MQTNKVVVLEDLAAQFKLKTQFVIDRIQELQAEGRLTGKSLFESSVLTFLGLLSVYISSIFGTLGCQITGNPGLYLYWIMAKLTKCNDESWFLALMST